MQRTYRLIVGVLLGTLLFFSRTATVESGEPCTPKIDPTGVIRDYQAINVCTAQGGLVRLENRTYHIEGTVRVKSHTIIEGPSVSRTAVFLAVPSLGNQAILDAKGSNLTVRNLLVNGNKLKRDYLSVIQGVENGKSVAHYLCDAEGWRPPNIMLSGSDITIEGVESVNAPCGAALGLLGERITVRNNRIAHNGFEAPKLIASSTGMSEEPRWPGFSHQLSDGITVIFCRDCEIVDNILEENTDLSLVLGGGPNNLVRGNHCIVKSVYALGCFSIGRFSGGFPGWDGNHAGLIFEENTVSAAEGTAVYGITIGSYFYCHSTNPACKYVVVHDAGMVRRNTVAGAKVNVGVHGLEAGTIEGNIIGEALSESPNFFVPCQLKERYVVGFVKSGVVLQPGAKRVVIFGSECK